MTTVPLKNSNSLLFLDKKQSLDQISLLETAPTVVLLTAWEQSDSSSFQQIGLLIAKLIDRGCKYFVCAGRYSELLHDFIDDVIIDVSLNAQNENSDSIMTTWHDADTDNDVADFFLHSTNVSNALLVAFLDKGSPEDRGLEKAVYSLAERDQKLKKT